VQLVAATRDNASPSFVLEFLKRISVIIKVRGALFMPWLWDYLAVFGAGRSWLH
jgi:hypothetical protein